MQAPDLLVVLGRWESLSISLAVLLKQLLQPSWAYISICVIRQRYLKKSLIMTQLSGGAWKFEFQQAPPGDSDGLQSLKTTDINH